MDSYIAVDTAHLKVNLYEKGAQFFSELRNYFTYKWNETVPKKSDSFSYMTCDFCFLYHCHAVQPIHLLNFI